MTGKVNDGDTVKLIPVNGIEMETGDIVLVRVSGRDYLHLIKAVSRQRFLIGNNRGGINGWVGKNAIYSKATEVTR